MSHAISAKLVSEDARAFVFDVAVREKSGETRHEVSLSREMLSRLAPGVGAEAFVQSCFEFLLAREPKESILSRFDVSVIPRYFPEFEREILQKRPR